MHVSTCTLKLTDFSFTPSSRASSSAVSFLCLQTFGFSSVVFSDVVVVVVVVVAAADVLAVCSGPDGVKHCDVLRCFRFLVEKIGMKEKQEKKKKSAWLGVMSNFNF